MMPGINPRQMKQAMKRMGIQQQDIPAEQVIIRLKDMEIIIDNPSVQKVNMMGQSSYQVSGEEIVRSTSSEPIITDEDVKTVSEQANCSEEKARKALEESNGDLAEAIMKLSE